MKRSLPRTSFVAGVVVTCVLGVAAGASATTATKKTPTTSQPKLVHSYPHLTATSSFGEVLDNPAFAGFALYMTPTEDPSAVPILPHYKLPDVAPRFGQVWDPQTLADGLNFVVDQVNAGRKVWYPLYSDKEIAADPSKKTAGVWFFPGDPKKPLAIIAAGGGFRAVASIQEAFPHAQKLHELGYNVAVLKYRVNTALGQGQTTQTTTSSPTTQTTQAQGQTDQTQKNVAIDRANEDMATAMKMLRDKARAWHISFANYSVWGSSAGGEVMTAWASKGAKANGFGPPTVVVGAYTPPEQIKVSSAFPPYFATDAVDDKVVSPANVAASVDQLKAKGVAVKYDRWPGGGHGFGLGVGTPAAGWIKDAIAFWKSHMTN
jgi:acetyl esterase/lipase